MEGLRYSGRARLGCSTPSAGDSDVQLESLLSQRRKNGVAGCGEDAIGRGLQTGMQKVRLVLALSGRAVDRYAGFRRARQAAHNNLLKL